MFYTIRVDNWKKVIFPLKENIDRGMWIAMTNNSLHSLQRNLYNVQHGLAYDSTVIKNLEKIPKCNFEERMLTLLSETLKRLKSLHFYLQKWETPFYLVCIFVALHLCALRVYLWTGGFVFRIWEPYKIILSIFFLNITLKSNVILGGS
jgi:hypothetical protein